MATDPYNKITIDDVINKISNNQRTVRDYIDEIFLSFGRGKLTTIRDKQLSGFNHRQTAVNLPDHADHNGYCFFVRPTMNLSRFNAMRDRHLAQLITNIPYSIQQWVRMTLDFTLESREQLSSPLIDNQNVFIPLLSNSLKTLTGVPSIVAGTHSSERGIAKEVFTMIDDNIYNYETYTVTATFRNMNGNPFLLLFYSWILAASLQYMGKIVASMPDIIQRRMNYTSRIYRLIMDHTKTYVTGIWAPAYCYPVTLETGSIFKYNIEEPLNRDMATMDVQFQCAGSIINDDLLFHQFNTAVAMANPMMDNTIRSQTLVKLDRVEVDVLNYYGYPRINPVTTELEWWVPREIYQSAAEVLKKQLRFPNNNPDPQVERNNQIIEERKNQLMNLSSFVDKL